MLFRAKEPGVAPATDDNRPIRMPSPAR
jgi:hypothetical protein